MTAGDLPTRSRILEPTGPARSAVRRALAFRSDAGPLRVHRGLPSPWLTVVFTLSDPIPVQVPEGDRFTERRFTALVGGLHTRAVRLPQSEAQAGIQLDIHPLACRSLFGMPAGELAGAVVELPDVVGRSGAQLVERIHRTDAGAAFNRVQNWSNRQLQTNEKVPPPEVVQAWRLIVGSAGRIRIGEVASRVGWSRRHLTDQLRRETGLAAKDLARVARFETAVGTVRRRLPGTLADVAAACGYSDQAQLSTEWREFAGCTPTEWIGGELPHLVPDI